MASGGGRSGSWVCVLGPVELRVEGQSVALSELQRRLVATLAIHSDQRVSAERLIFSLWGDAAPRSARNRIRADLSRELRRVHPAAEANLNVIYQSFLAQNPPRGARDSANGSQIRLESGAHGVSQLRHTL